MNGQDWMGPELAAAKAKPATLDEVAEAVKAGCEERGYWCNHCGQCSNCVCTCNDDDTDEDPR